MHWTTLPGPGYNGGGEYLNPRVPDRPRVLVVDDDPDLCRAWTTLLARHGFLAAAVSDPARAARRADEFRPHLALLDFDMPRMTGPELAVLLRKTPVMKDVPLVLLADGADEDHREIAAASGVAACVDKSGDEAALVNLIRSLVRVLP